LSPSSQLSTAGGVFAAGGDRQGEGLVHLLRKRQRLGGVRRRTAETTTTHRSHRFNRENVDQLQVAWTFDTGEPGGLQSSPLIGRRSSLRKITPDTENLCARTPRQGPVRWKFDFRDYWAHNRTVGSHNWSDGKSSRILVGSLEFCVRAGYSDRGSRYLASAKVAALTCAKNLGREPTEEQSNLSLTSPVVVYKGPVHCRRGGIRKTLPAAAGRHSRASTVRTGEIADGPFHTISAPGESFGYETWPTDALGKTSGRSE